jgi:hypothetical protein
MESIMRNLPVLTMFLCILFLAACQSDKQAKKSVTELAETPLFANFSFDDSWQKNWGIAWMQRAETGQVITESELSGASGLVVTYPKGAVGPSQGGMQFTAQFANIPNISTSGFDEIYLRYRIFFEPGFDFVKGGKLPGLMGGGDSWSRSGGNQPNGENGWTMRFMWRENGEAVVYSYLPSSPNGKYGNQVWGLDLPLGRRFTWGQWYTIEERIKVNEIGRENGELSVWFDGELVMQLNDITYRTKDNEHGKIGGVMFSTFHGGNDASWAPSVTSKARFSEFVVSSKPIDLIAHLKGH